MSDPVESNTSHEQWCHDRIQTLESECETARRDLHEVLYDNRARRHHDVLCLVLKESIRARVAISQRLSDADVAEFVRWSHRAADLAYPPPKEQL